MDKNCKLERQFYRLWKCFDPSEDPIKDRASIKRMGNCENDGGQVGRLRELVRNIVGLREVSSKDSLHRLVPCCD